VEPATDAAGAANAIAVADVHKTFRGGVHALRGVTLEVAPGEIVGLLGRNGAGKTTLVKILLDLVRPTRGATRLLGIPSRTPRARREVGYLPEDHRFPDYHTAESALCFYGGLSGLGGARLRARARELLGRFGLAAARGRKIRSFSKGMKQRLGLAQVFLAEPRLLFLDEPTDGVDPVGRREIRGLMQDLKSRGTTIFLNSHLLGEVELICDRVAIMDRGRILALDTVAGLIAAHGAAAVVEGSLVRPPADPARFGGRLDGLAFHIETASPLEEIARLSAAGAEFSTLNVRRTA
jgi:ABC-2 type transport system ATP-binding protein